MIERSIIKKTLKVPFRADANYGDGATEARQLDAALMKVGFKMSGPLMKLLSSLTPETVIGMSGNILDAVRELVGANFKHNVYFVDFPENVPDTLEFWLECIADALASPDKELTEKIEFQLSVGVINLLDLPKYGKYQHTYEEMLEAHEEFIPSVKDRLTILHVGKSLDEEAQDLYQVLSGSVIPLNDKDKDLLTLLAEHCKDGAQPESIPIRENRALVNFVLIKYNKVPIVDTVTDVLRLACALSDGDETLEENTKFKSFSRRVRRCLMEALNGVIKDSPAKLADVNRHREQWKRLGERIHPHEFTGCTWAQDVFAVARRDKKARSIVANAELAFADGNIAKAAGFLAKAPGVLFRNLDRILRVATDEEIRIVLATVADVAPKVSGRVILSVREHLTNRVNGHKLDYRIFANSKGTAWVEDDERKPISVDIAADLFEIFDKEVHSRVPEVERLVVDKAILDVVAPLSDKNRADGFNIMPRGTTHPIGNDLLRFFIHWKQKEEQTDYDLSVIMLGDDYTTAGHISYTNLRGVGGKHSGDITNAPHGASEFIDIDLKKVECKYIIPSVLIYSGEDFLEAEESIFGYMERTEMQRGEPFVPATVRSKFDMRGKGKIALPIVFIKSDNGEWTAKWLNLYINGNANFNNVETSKVSTALITKAMIEREYLKLAYLVGLMSDKAKSFSYLGDKELTEPVTFIGLETPEGLPEGSKVYNLGNIHELIPS